MLEARWYVRHKVHSTKAARVLRVCLLFVLARQRVMVVLRLLKWMRMHDDNLTTTVLPLAQHLRPMPPISVRMPRNDA